jgi:hypothetical protein
MIFNEIIILYIDFTKFNLDIIELNIKEKKNEKKNKN